MAHTLQGLTPTMSNKALRKVLTGSFTLPGTIDHAYHNSRLERCPDCNAAGTLSHMSMYTHRDDCTVARKDMLQVIQTALAALPTCTPTPTPPPYRTVDLPDGYRWLEPTDVVHITDMYKRKCGAPEPLKATSLKIGQTAGTGDYSTGDDSEWRAGYCRRIDDNT